MFQFGNRLIFVFKNFHSLLMICYTSVKIKSRHFCDGKIHTVKTKRCYILSLYLRLVSCHSRDVAWHDKAMVLSPHLVFLLIGQVLASILFSVP